MRLSIGIDCGLDGGLVTLDDRSEIVAMEVYPAVKAGKGRVVDLAYLNRFIESAATSQFDVSVCIEDPGGHAQSASGLRSMTRCFTAVEALCVAHKLRYHTFASQTWQKEFWKRPKMPIIGYKDPLTKKKPIRQKFDTKAAALLACGRLWPSQTFLPSSRHRKPHDGLIDAALIAEYGRRNYL